MHQAALVSSDTLIPPESASGTTPEGVMLTETFDGPSTCPLNTVCEWTIIFVIENHNLTNAFTEVKVTERLGAELTIELTGPKLIPIVSPPSQLVWYWGYDVSGVPSESYKYTIWIRIEILPAGASAWFEWTIWTDENPAKEPKQEYTECGPHTLNSGPVLDYEEKPGQYSEWGWQWIVDVPCEVVSLFSDALLILPIAVLSGALVVLRKRR